jgi:fibronectin type 3 domain-containing protein
MGATLSKPQAPNIYDAKFDGSKIILNWNKVDSRTKSFIVQRVAKTGWFDSVTKTFKTASKRFVDTKLTPQTVYLYTVYAVDENGIKSLASNEVKIEVGDIKVINEIPQTVKSQPKEVIKQEAQTQIVAPIEDLEVNEK